ncbi:MAG: phosphoribosylformylglycinamidine synthase II, partial [Alphaproteobacteria bacterium]|nr:phosphoribosylformylglycinamidine synthase II [Alphaproteobacteria bacterium]
ELETQAEAIFKKWGLDFAIVGKTTDTLRFVVKHEGVTKADLPIKELGDEAPLYGRSFIETPKKPIIAAEAIKPPCSDREALLKLISTPNLCSKRWVWEQYDHLILGNSIRQPGGDAAIIRIKEGPKGLALTTDVTARYCAADPFEGGKQAVAEAWRNITVRGATPLALTDNLNFGNPERPEIMGQFVGCLKGIGEAARALDFPIVSGNVSLYNETQGAGILPTPAIGGVGVIADVATATHTGFTGAGQAVLLIGATQGWLGQSAYARDLCSFKEGAPPPVDLNAERRNGAFLRGLIASGRVSVAHDLSDGGLGVALVEMALAGNIGAKLTQLPQGPTRAALFGEDQARYLIAVTPETVEPILGAARAENISILEIGVTGGAEISWPGEKPISLTELREAFEKPLPAYMAGDDRAFA